MAGQRGREGGLRLEQRVHGDVQGERGSAWEAVWSCVRRIPRGRVMTYGQIATLTENRLSARAVGWALHTCPGNVPWQRVVNASGRCSTDRRQDMPPGLQQALLEGEGIVFGDDGALDLARYRYVPRQRGLRRRSGSAAPPRPPGRASGSSRA